MLESVAFHSGEKVEKEPTDQHSPAFLSCPIPVINALTFPILQVRGFSVQAVTTKFHVVEAVKALLVNVSGSYN